MSQLKEITSFLPLSTEVWGPVLSKWYKLYQKFLHQLIAMDVNKYFRKLECSKYIPVEMPSKIAKFFLKSLLYNIAL